MALPKLIVNIGVNLESFEKGFNDLQKSITKTGLNLKRSGEDLTKAFTVPLLAMGAGLLKVESMFGDAFDKIRTDTGKTGDALRGLEKDFDSVFASMPTSASDVAAAISTLNTRLGLSGEPLQELSRQFINLSKLTGEDLSGSMEAATRAFGDWGVSADNQSDTLDRLYRVTQQTGIGFTSLSNSLVQFGSPLRQMGFDLDTTAALLGKFEAEGVNTALVMGSLRQALTRMAQAGATDLPGALAASIEKIKEFQTSGEAAAAAAKIFGARAGADMAAAIREGRFEVGELVQKLKESPDKINDVAEEFYGLEESLIKARNAIMIELRPASQALELTLNEKLKPILEDVRESAGKLAKAFQDLSPDTKALVAQIVLFFGVIGPGLIAVGSFILAMKHVISVFGFVIPVLKTAVVALGMLYTYLTISVIPGLLLAGQAVMAFAKTALITVLIPAAKAVVVALGALVAAIGLPGVAILAAITAIYAFRDAIREWIDDILTAEISLKSLARTMLSFAKSLPYVGAMATGLEMFVNAISDGEKEQKKLNKEAEKTPKIYDKVSDAVDNVSKETTKASKALVESFDKVQKEVKSTDQATNDLVDDLIGGSRKAKDEVKKLQEQFHKLRTDEIEKIKFDKLQQGIKDAIKNLKQSDFQASLSSYEKAFKESTIRSLMDAYKISFDEAADLASIRWDEIAGDYQDQMIEANKQAFKESVSFFESIFQNAITGQAFDLRDALEQVAVGFASQMAATLSGGFSADGGVKGFGQGLANMILGEFKIGVAEYLPGALGEAGKTATGYGSAMSSGAISAAAAAIAPVAVAAVGAAYGYNVYDAAKGLLDGKGGNDRESGINAALSSNLITAWIPTVAKIFGISDLGFGSGGDQMARDREAMRQVLEDVMNIDLDFGPRDRFEQEWASAFRNVAGESMTAFEIAGIAMQQFFELTEGTGPQIGFLLAESIGGSIEEVKYALYGLGIDLSGMEEQFVKMGVSGKKSWLDVEVSLQGLSELTQEGINGIGQYVTAFQHLVESGGRGAKAIMSVKNLAIESMEDGAKSLADLEAKLRASGRFTDEQIGALFQALSQRGITSLEQLAGASDRELGGIVADIEAMAPAFFQVSEGMQEFVAEAEKLSDAWSKVPESMKTDYQINIKLTGDKVPEGVKLHGQGGLLTGIKGIQNFAKGGLLNSATLMGVSNGIAQIAGEAGAEWALPAVRMADGSLGVAATGGGGTVINIDARGAAPGVEVAVRNAMRDYADQFNKIPGRFR